MRDLPEWLQEFTENLVDESVPDYRNAPASYSRELSSDPRGKVVSGSTVLKLTSRRTEIARSVRGPNLQGPRAEDAMAEPYAVLKIF